MTRWVFLRGLMRDARHWGEFPELFRRSVPASRIVTPDLPGNGVRNGERSPARIEAMVEHCRRELLAAGAPPPYEVLALSLGAMVALAWAERHPQEVAGLVLIGTSLGRHSPPRHRLRPGALPALLRLALPGARPETLETLIFGLTSGSKAGRAATVSAWSDYRRACPVARGNALRQLLAAARYRGPAERPRPPLLLLAGAADRLVDPRCSRRIANAWEAALAIHPRAGHDVPLDDPAWVVERVSEWLATRSTGSS